MLDSFLSGLFLGFGVSIPFGPVNILILTYALKAFKNSIAVGLGAFSMDMAYLFLVHFGLLAFLENVIFMRFLTIFSFCFLTFMAYSMLKSQKKNLNLKQEEFKEKLFKSYIKGAFLNGINPFVIGFWLSIASVLSNKYVYWMSLGLMFAILSWVGVLAFVVARYSHFFSLRVIFAINVISAIIIEYFALSLIYKNFIG